MSSARIALGPTVNSPSGDCTPMCSPDGRDRVSTSGAGGSSASAIDWLLDTEQAWVTGQVLGVDGGLSRVRSRA